jgi:hypothetical protein
LLTQIEEQESSWNPPCHKNLRALQLSETLKKTATQDYCTFVQSPWCRIRVYACSGILHRILTAPWHPGWVGYFSCLTKELVTRLNFGSASVQAAQPLLRLVILCSPSCSGSIQVLLRLLTISSPKLSPVFGPSLLLATYALPTSAVPHELCQLYAKVSGGPVLGTHKNRSPHGALNPHAWCIWSRVLHLPYNIATSSAVDVRAALSSLFPIPSPLSSFFVYASVLNLVHLISRPRVKIYISCRLCF